MCILSLLPFYISFYVIFLSLASFSRVPNAVYKHLDWFRCLFDDSDGVLTTFYNCMNRLLIMNDINDACSTCCRIHRLERDCSRIVRQRCPHYSVSLHRKHRTLKRFIEVGREYLTRWKRLRRLMDCRIPIMSKLQLVEYRLSYIKL